MVKQTLVCAFVLRFKILSFKGSFCERCKSSRPDVVLITSYRLASCMSTPKKMSKSSLPLGTVARRVLWCLDWFVDRCVDIVITFGKAVCVNRKENAVMSSSALSALMVDASLR